MDYNIETLDAHTWLIEEHGGPASVYLYLLEGENEAALIDTGMGTLPLDTICQGLTTKPIKVLLTHGHVDHIGGTGLFRQVYLDEKDVPCYKLHSSDAVRKAFFPGVLPPTKETLSYLEGGDVFDLGGRTIEVIATPGHTVGSVCFLDRERRWLFSGDTCCKAHVLLQMEYAAPLAIYLDSINKLLRRQAEYTTSWPGHHGKPVGVDVILQFKEAAEGLLNGSLVGADVTLGGQPMKLLSYKDIGIEYR